MRVASQTEHDSTPDFFPPNVKSNDPKYESGQSKSRVVMRALAMYTQQRSLRVPVCGQKLQRYMLFFLSVKKNVANSWSYNKAVAFGIYILSQNSVSGDQKGGGGIFLAEVFCS